ncbi:MAG: cobalamin biosynthesis protein [Thermoproteus sp.]
MRRLELLWRGLAVVYASEAGRKAAERLSSSLKGAVPSVLFGYKELDSAWGCYDAYVFIMAIGGTVRALCRRLKDKELDPPVVAASHDLRYFIPLVGMHRGANELARELAELVGGVVVETTAAEAAGFAPVEDVERALLCELSEEDRLEVYRRLLSGGEVCIDADLPFNFTGYRIGSGCEVTIRVGCEGPMCCRPLRLYAGFGATSRATPEEIAEAIAATLRQIGAKGVEAVASIRDEVYAVARILGAKPVKLSPEQLAEDICLSPPSKKALEAKGVANVAEASALAAAGPGAKLVYRKRAFGGKVTVAVAAKA